MLSFITGQLTVDLDIMPDSPPVDPASLPPFRGIQQIPTVPSSMNALFDSLDNIPLDELVNKTLALLDGFHTQLSGMDLPALVSSLTAASGDLRGKMARWDEVFDRAGSALDEYSALARHVGPRLDSSLRRLDSALERISSLALSSQQAMDKAAGLLSEDSAPLLELSQAMQALREASLAVTNLATLLELRPESLLFGRSP
jgi:paraquat-inducible protein B